MARLSSSPAIVFPDFASPSRPCVADVAAEIGLPPGGATDDPGVIGRPRCHADVSMTTASGVPQRYPLSVARLLPESGTVNGAPAPFERGGPSDSAGLLLAQPVAQAWWQRHTHPLLTLCGQAVAVCLAWQAPVCVCHCVRPS